MRRLRRLSSSLAGPGRGARRAVAALVLAAVSGCAAAPARSPEAQPAEAQSVAPAPAAAPPAGAAPDAAVAPADDAPFTAEPPAPADAPPGKALEAGGADGGDPMVSLAEAEAALDRALRGPKKGPAAGADRPAGAPRPQGAADPCTIACQALASMRRSADRLCDLSSHGGPRCDEARARVTRAAGRVKERCPACHPPG